MASTSPAAGIGWDLSDLYSGPEDPRLREDLAHARQQAEAFARRFRGTIEVPGGPTATHLATAVAELERISAQAARPAIYADLLHAADTTPQAHGALVALTQEQASAIRQELLFLELEWLALDDTVAATLIEDPACAPWRHFLSSQRRYRPHILREGEERILEEKANTGHRALGRLFDDVLSNLRFHVTIAGQVEEKNESEVLALLHAPEPEVREAAASALTQGLQGQDRLLSFVFNTLVHDHAIDDRLRQYGEPMASRHLANEIEGSVVDALLQACEEQRELVQRYYRLKGQLLGLPVLRDFDRYAPLGSEGRTYSWPEARDIVLDAYGAFSPRMREIASRFFTSRWIDAEPRDGKRGGAFSASTLPSLHPFVLLNYTGLVHDVMTLAHELGHGVHQDLSRPRGFLQMDTPLTMAETASVFGEMLVFQHLRASTEDPRERLVLLCRKIEDTIATVFRQVVLTRFEQQVHRVRREDGELARERFGDLWMEANATLYGDSVELTDGYRAWWSYIPHFIHTPFYCYAYAFGELLVLSLFEIYRREGSSFVPKYLDLLAAGGADTPENLLAPFGIDIRSPSFWRQGLEPFRVMVEEAEELARQTGRID